MKNKIKEIFDKETIRLIVITISLTLVIIMTIYSVLVTAMANDLTNIVIENKKAINTCQTNLNVSKMKEQEIYDLYWDLYYYGVNQYEGDYEYYE